MRRYFKLYGCILIILYMLAVSFSALSQVIVVPSGVTSIGDEAFAGLDAVDGVVVPKSVTQIGSNAFDSKIIYGEAGSFAETYAISNGLTFRTLAIENAHINASAQRAFTDGTLDFTVYADCEYPELTYRFYASKNGWMVKDSGVVSTSNFSFTFEQSGVYSVWAYVYHPWDVKRVDLMETVIVHEPLKRAAGDAHIAVGQRLQLISSAETRSVTLASDDATIVQTDGLDIIGRALGKTYVTATVVSELGAFTERIPVEVVVPVESVVILDSVERLELGQSATFRAQVSPWNATDQVVLWSSSNPGVASVTDEGVVTANTQGICEISCMVGGKRATIALRCAVFVKSVSVAPVGAVPSPIYTNNQIPLAASVFPWNADTVSVVWTSLDESVATVDANGVVSCVGAGSVRIVCTAADGGGAQATYDLIVLQGPEHVIVTGDRANINLSERARLTAEVLPSTIQNRTVIWSSSDDTIARIDANGEVTPVSLGTVLLTATAHNGVIGQYPLTVSAPRAPTSLSLGSGTIYMNPGETRALSVTAYPENSIEQYTWSTSAKSIARVDASGVVTGVAAGSATIKVTSAADLNVVASIRVVVLSNSRTLVMPARKTSVSGISSNLIKINNVLASSTNELTSLMAAGKISQSEMNARKSVIAAAFQMYAFPWMTLNTQPYWRAANSENGAKDYQPGIVYYGIPYNSTYGAPRYYNVTMLLNENRFYKSSGSYYILNQKNLLNGTYCGNDCSAMIALAFGSKINTSITWRTTEFYNDTANFRTLSNPADLRPGDIMVREGRHVVVFLYYASSAKTQVVVIEQGGTEAGINTVSTGIYNLSYYTQNSYKGRRLRAWN